MSTRTNRRQFIQQTTAAAGSLCLAGCASSPFSSGRARFNSPNEKLNIAGVGVGGKGASDLKSSSEGQNVVAICDVDDHTLAKSAALYPGARKYNDWRRLLEQPDIDAVTVSTPDHMHAPIAMAAMQLGKHVYVQKPMSHTIYEARQLTWAAREYRVVSQMGNQNHSGPGYRTLVQLIRSGAIGRVKAAHAWSNRPIWPQGIPRPAGDYPPPANLHWDLWLGVAAHRPFVGPAPDAKRGPYHPFNWRGFLDFGVGALGDMGCHIIDPVFWSLDLGAPVRVWSAGPPTNGETFPQWGIIHYEFAKTRYTAGPIRMTWYDGGKMPDRDLIPLPAQEKTPLNASLFIGEKGTLLCEHGKMPRLLPAEQFEGRELAKVEGDNHYLQWTNACKGQGKATAHFDYSGPLTETVLLGTVAVRFPEYKLDWDSEQMIFTNVPEANAFVHKQYRDGWSVQGLG